MTKHFLTSAFSTLISLLILTSCLSEDPIELEAFDAIKQANIDDSLIQNYLTVNNFEAQKDPSGVYYIIDSTGDGNHPTINSTVDVKYKGYFIDNTIFDQTQNDTLSFPLNYMISGWQYGIPYLSRGGGGKLFIPSGLAYGNLDYGPIPKNSVVIFDVQLIDFQ